MSMRIDWVTINAGHNLIELWRRNLTKRHRWQGGQASVSDVRFVAQDNQLNDLVPVNREIEGEPQRVG
jgi:hypothetical protein